LVKFIGAYKRDNLGSAYQDGKQGFPKNVDGSGNVANLSATTFHPIDKLVSMLQNFLRPQVMTFQNKLERLSLASLSSLV
jgi:hypothetical protein